MPRFFIRLAFSGTAYCGWQMQPNGLSVQKLVSDGLTMILRYPVNVFGAGRTDAGVHAKEFYAHFDTRDRLTEAQCKQLVFQMNGILPKDVAVYEVFEVRSDDHARFSAVSRTYEYLISQRKDPFLLNKAWFFFEPLHVECMNEGAAILMEYDEFGCFSKSNTQVKTYRCHIMHAGWEQNGDLLRFTITANRFLRNMVRAIVGTLTELGRGRMTPDDLRKIIESGDRRLAGFSVPAEGLYLIKIVYPEEIGYFSHTDPQIGDIDPPLSFGLKNEKT